MLIDTLVSPIVISSGDGDVEEMALCSEYLLIVTSVYVLAKKSIAPTDHTWKITLSQLAIASVLS